MSSEHEKPTMQLNDAVLAEIRAKARVLSAGQGVITLETGPVLALLDEIERLRAEQDRLNEELDWQNKRNSGRPTRGGYEFYINEEWSGIAAAALDSDPGWTASLRKTRMDPDDDRVRVRRVVEDDALLGEIDRLNGQLAEARKHESEAQDRAEAQLRRGDEFQRELDQVRAEARKCFDAAERADQLDSLLRRIGEISGCDHIDERLPMCIRDRIDAAERERDEAIERFQLETLRTSDQFDLLKRAEQQFVASWNCPCGNERECCRIVKAIRSLAAQPVNDVGSKKRITAIRSRIAALERRNAALVEAVEGLVSACESALPKLSEADDYAKNKIESVLAAAEAAGKEGK